MAAVKAEEVSRVVEFSLSKLKWKLRPSSKHRLQTDILALVTQMRPVIMVDYGGKMPELQDKLCSFLKNCRKESSVFKYLKVMVMEDMIYMIHTLSLAKFVNSYADSQKQVLFIDLERDPPKIVTQSNDCSAISHLVSIQKRFSTLFSKDGIFHIEEADVLLDDATATPSTRDSAIYVSSELIDLSHWIQETVITLPSLNGWLLGYPVVYLFCKEHIQDAVYNLSAKSLHLFNLFVTRNGTSNGAPHKEELMSFTIPYELSLEGGNEAWAKEFVAKMRLKLEGCKQVWVSMEMEAKKCYPQPIAL